MALKLENEVPMSLRDSESLFDSLLMGERYFESLELLRESLDFLKRSPRRLLSVLDLKYLPESDLEGVFMRECSIES